MKDSWSIKRADTAGNDLISQWRNIVSGMRTHPPLNFPPGYRPVVTGAEGDLFDRYKLPPDSQYKMAPYHHIAEILRNRKIVGIPDDHPGTMRLNDLLRKMDVEEKPYTGPYHTVPRIPGSPGLRRNAIRSLQILEDMKNGKSLPPLEGIPDPTGNGFLDRARELMRLSDRPNRYSPNQLATLEHKDFQAIMADIANEGSIEYAPSLPLSKQKLAPAPVKEYRYPPVPEHYKQPVVKTADPPAQLVNPVARTSDPTSGFAPAGPSRSIINLPDVRTGAPPGRSIINLPDVRTGAPPGRSIINLPYIPPGSPLAKGAPTSISRFITNLINSGNSLSASRTASGPNTAPPRLPKPQPTREPFVSRSFLGNRPIGQSVPSPNTPVQASSTLPEPTSRPVPTWSIKPPSAPYHQAAGSNGPLQPRPEVKPYVPPISQQLGNQVRQELHAQNMYNLGRASGSVSPPPSSYEPTGQLGAKPRGFGPDVSMGSANRGGNRNYRSVI